MPPRSPLRALKVATLCSKVAKKCTQGCQNEGQGRQLCAQGRQKHTHKVGDLGDLRQNPRIMNPLAPARLECRTAWLKGLLTANLLFRVSNTTSLPPRHGVQFPPDAGDSR